ncbi:hypothetical protein UC34_20005 [Pandoraea vervacti]|uniref:Uncharacterized protein n=1 Tax=Pandoraea vervacti TaxID=656178 RepID=A0ABM5T1E3_9BURK|nr:hypothetical protein UC34_20005 [Pandoraea vervacti]
MPSHSSNASPMPFPFLPVVIESPTSPQSSRTSKGAPACGSASSPATADIGQTSSRSGDGRAKARAGRRGTMNEAAQPPGMDAQAGIALRVEVVRRVSPDGLTVLGGIVR